jgi:uncharacterized membrane protein
MVLAVLVGIVVGALSVAPFKVAMKKIRSANPSHSLDMLAPFLLTILISFIILIAGMIVCKLAAPDYAVVFSITEILAFVASVLIVGFVVSKRR